jgi:serine O-acetyltransferase
MAQPGIALGAGLKAMPVSDPARIRPEPDTASGWNLESIVSGLRAVRNDWRKRHRRIDQEARELPSREVLERAARDLCGLLFPMRLGPNDLREENTDYYVGHALGEVLQALERQILLELRSAPGLEDPVLRVATARQKTRRFGESLPGLRRLLDQDVEAAFQGDPAARSVDEVLLCYPGILAVIHHRLAHALHRLELPLVARIVAEIAHSATGIDIHPGAEIGAGFFIDHGTGVVIGETAVIGERVRLYQAVTLGAKSFPKGENGALEKGLRRHPIVEDDVVIYAGATVLGRITIGRGSVIGGNVWLTRSVPAGSLVTQAGHTQETRGGAGAS